MEHTGPKQTREFAVKDLCVFKLGDIRQQIIQAGNYDVIFLGSIGQALGDHAEALSRLKQSLQADGLIILDDAYIEDQNTYNHPQVLKKSILFEKINLAGLKIIDEHKEYHLQQKHHEYDDEYLKLEIRCRELSLKHPEKSQLFDNYLFRQKTEYNVMKNNIISSTLVLKAA
jgi:predicted O-methyltransferase YrrM